jgi:hypothetical protein
MVVGRSGVGRGNGDRGAWLEYGFEDLIYRMYALDSNI